MSMIAADSIPRIFRIMVSAACRTRSAADRNSDQCARWRAIQVDQRVPGAVRLIAE